MADGTMKMLLKDVLEKTSLGQVAELKFHIEGKEYTRIFRPRERLILLGGGHISKAVSQLASTVGFQVVIVDDRPEFASEERFPEAMKVICKPFNEAIKELQVNGEDYLAIMTRGHRYDAECLHAILDHGMPKYVGLLGSKRRTRILLALMKEEGVPAEHVEAVKTPIGLDIGALTVEEIAISIVAELIQTRRKNQRKNVCEGTFAEETFHMEVLEDLVQDEKPRVLILVYETSGSTPVKSGCFMSLDEDGTATGTIGGGLVEARAVAKARKMVGTKEETTIEINLNNDIASQEGMVCGGNMLVYLKDLSS